MGTTRTGAMVVALMAGAALARADTWTEQVSNSPAPLYVVHAVNDQIAWAAGDDGQVVRTVDGGSNWEPRPTPSVVHTAIFAFDGQTCVVADATGPFWRTSDAGFNWTQVHDAATFMNGIHFFDTQRGWAVGDPITDTFVILETTDGGASWAASPGAPSGTFGYIGSYDWVGSQTAVFGSQALIYRTTNGGLDWHSVAASSQQVTALVLDQSGIGLAGYDILDRSTDFGASWHPIPGPPTARWLNFDWIEGTQEVWGHTGQGGVYHSTNAGTDWEHFVLAPAVEHYIEDLSFADRVTGWCVGTHNGAGGIWRYDGDPITSIADARTAPEAVSISSHPNPFRTRTTIRFELPGSTPVEVCIVDASGRQVTTLTRSMRGPGVGEFAWDGRDRSGRPVASGTYLIRVRGDGITETGRITRVR